MNLDRGHLLTEQRLTASMQLDAMPIEEAVALMQQQDMAAVAAVAAEGAAIARAVELVAQRLGAGGRLFYFGAGTSGRLGVLDASECPPTFRTDPDMIQATIAGGDGAMFRAVEGAEDDADAGASAVDQKDAGAGDVVIGIAAGGTTPFVHGALRRARERGAATIFLTCVQATPREPAVDLVIRPLVGPEVLTGSTRLKAGTATKLVLNTISTLAMVQLGKVYENLMVDLRATNTKLHDRAARIVGSITDLSREQSIALLHRAGGQVKRAIVMHRFAVPAADADTLLQAQNGNLRRTLQAGTASPGASADRV
jgi:N-acetylmuramic acid 6-phosphate etherase